VSTYELSHLPDSALLRDLETLLARDRTTTAELLAHLAEVDARRLYLPAAYPSMYAWCVGKLGLGEQAAFKRIRVARAARRFPAIYQAIADGRLHLSTVVLLAPYLTEATAEELLAAAAHKRTCEVEQLLAQRFPRPDLPAQIEALSPPPANGQLSSRTVVGIVPAGPPPTGASTCDGELSLRTVGDPAPATDQPMVPARIESAAAPPRLTPLSPQRHGIQFTVDQATLDLLRDVQALLGPQVPAHDLAAVFHRALAVLKRDLERQKFAATDEPRPGRPRSADSRHIPAEVKRAVWERDQGRCTFVSETGHRCEERSGVQFDHIDAYARGGSATVTSIRLRCHAHNQYDAERTFGAEFIRHKRLAAAGARDTAKLRAIRGSGRDAAEFS